MLEYIHLPVVFTSYTLAISSSYSLLSKLYSYLEQEVSKHMQPSYNTYSSAQTVLYYLSNCAHTTRMLCFVLLILM